jgi:hypothetical protein
MISCPRAAEAQQGTLGTMGNTNMASRSTLATVFQNDKGEEYRIQDLTQWNASV